MLVLALDAAGQGALVALVRDGAAAAMRRTDALRGVAAMLPTMVAAVLAGEGTPDLIAVTTGPGSFTGIRAALSLAQGMGLASGTPVIGVTVADAIRADPHADSDRCLWVALDSRRGRVFLDRRGHSVSTALDALPVPDGPIAIAGDAANAVAAALAARNVDVRLNPLRRPGALGISVAAVHLRQAGIPVALPQPLYVDAPEVRPTPLVRPAPA